MPLAIVSLSVLAVAEIVVIYLGHRHNSKCAVSFAEEVK